MSNLSNYFREMRLFRERMIDAYEEYQKNFKALDNFRGSHFYDVKTEELETEHNAKTKSIRERAKASLVPILDQMRQDAAKNIVTQPTADMVNVLSLLRMADRLTPTEVKLYAAQMRDCPLAIRLLRQIASSFQIIVAEPNAEIQLDRINDLDGAAAYYISSYTGFSGDPLASTTMQLIERGLHNESFYKQATANVSYYDSFTACDTVEKAESRFLNDITNSADRTGFEPNAHSATPEVKLHFDTVDHLVAYINKAVEGEPPVAQDVIRESILDDCPDNYGAVYRNYKATGEKLELNPKPDDVA
jgi:hypothetical protein